MLSSPIVIAEDQFELPAGVARLSTARTRAITSRAENGLTM